MATDALALRASLPELVAVFSKAEEDTRTAFKLIVDAERRINDAFTMAQHTTIHISACGTRYSDDFKNVDRALGIMRQAAWTCISGRLELKRVMSIVRANALQKYLERDDLPAITTETVETFAERWGGNIEGNFKEAVREVFDWLRPSERSKWGSGAYVTNSLLEVGPRVVLEGVVKRALIGPGFQVPHSYSQNLTALERVFLTLDGQGMRTRGWQSDLETAIEACGSSGRGQTEYFRFRACKKGTLHLEFLNLQLLARFNAIAGGKTIKPESSRAT